MKCGNGVLREFYSIKTGIQKIYSADELSHNGDFLEVFFDKKLVDFYNDSKNISVFSEVQFKLIEDDLDEYNVTLNNK